MFIWKWSPTWYRKWWVLLKYFSNMWLVRDRTCAHPFNYRILCLIQWMPLSSLERKRFRFKSGLLSSSLWEVSIVIDDQCFTAFKDIGTILSRGHSILHQSSLELVNSRIIQVNKITRHAPNDKGILKSTCTSSRSLFVMTLSSQAKLFLSKTPARFELMTVRNSRRRPTS